MEKHTRKNLILVGVAIAAGLFAAWRLTRPSGAAIGVPETLVSSGVCLSCKQEMQVKHATRDAGPYLCPGCNESAVFRWMYCQNCNHRFVPNLIQKPGKPPRPDPFAYCPHCGCETVEPFRPESPEQTPVGDAPLPKWP